MMVLLAHATVGWVLCGAIMGFGLRFASLETTLLVHAAAIPVIFGAITFFYFKRFRYTTPFQTAVVFLVLVVVLDVVVVALMIERSFAMFMIERSFAMFHSILGTWLPFFLIFLSTYLVGLYANGDLPWWLDSV
jgi:hypothetical protein